MTKHKHPILAAVLVIGLGLVSELKAQKNAGDYLEVIGKEFNEIQTKTWDYTRSVAHDKSAKKVEKNRRDVVTATTAAQRRINNLRPFDGSSSLRDSALSFLKINYAVINEDYAKLMDLEEIAEQSYDHMEAYMTAREKANEKLQLAGEMIDKEYSRFAADHNIKLLENNSRLAKNMEIAGKVYDHYNEVYLVFFKSYKQEAYLMAAIEKNDVNGIEQNKNALVKTSSEGLEKLKTLKPYERDASVIKACQDVLAFYKEESEKKLADASKFFVAKDNFQKLKTGFEAKPANKRTKEDVDQFNAAISDYNKISDDFNKVNSELNVKRANVINNWNAASSRFTDRHVPNR